MQMLSDVFVEGGNLHIVLLFHLDLPCKGLFLDFPFYYAFIYIYHSFVVSFEVETYDTFNFILFQECFGYSGSLAFPYKF